MARNDDDDDVYTERPSSKTYVVAPPDDDKFDFRDTERGAGDWGEKKREVIDHLMTGAGEHFMESGSEVGRRPTPTDVPVCRTAAGAAYRRSLSSHGALPLQQ